jgi:hypothetical protein
LQRQPNKQLLSLWSNPKHSRVSECGVLVSCLQYMSYIGVVSKLYKCLVCRCMFHFILLLWFWQTIETYISCYICILNPWNISKILTQYTHSPSLFCLGVICGVFFGSIFYLKVFWSTLWQGISDRHVQHWSIEALVSWWTTIHVSFFLLIFCCFSNLIYNLD